MAVGATLCDLCREEGFRPTKLMPADHADEWDGVSYTSLRRNRPADVPFLRYEALLLAVLGPDDERIVLGPPRGEQPTGEAA
jgi:hypothetical protein